MKESVVFTYGRFNPPHLGHKMMIEEMMKLKKKVVVVVSHSQDNKKNPLSVADKVKILKTWFPNLDVRASSKTTSIAKIAENFNEDSVMVVGEDRAKAFDFIPVKKRAVTRPPNAPSATKARTAAKAGNIATFKNLTGYNNKNIVKKIQGSPKVGTRRV
jgi:cytidyltransferase-like protein